MKNILSDKKFKTLENLWCIPSHYLEAVDNYNKEKVITTNKITPTTSINETAKMPLLKLFLYFTFRDKCLYVYIIQGDIFFKISDKCLKKFQKMFP